MADPVQVRQEESQDLPSLLENHREILLQDNNMGRKPFSTILFLRQILNIK